MKSIRNDFNNIMQWSRYLVRACKIREISDKELEEENEKDSGIFPNEMFLLFFALLYVVIESFKQYSFQDCRISVLIGEKYNNQVSLLRKMRNSIFHPDTTVTSPRQSAFLNDSNKIIPWAYSLTNEFERYLYFYPESKNCHGTDADNLRDTLKKINNWLPNRSLCILKKQYTDELNAYKTHIRNHYPDHYEDFSADLINMEEAIDNIPDSLGSQFGIDLKNKNK